MSNGQTKNNESSKLPSEISRFMRRAEEIDRIEPVVAYYCFLRSCELAMEERPKPVSLVLELLEKLEVRLCVCMYIVFER